MSARHAPIVCDNTFKHVLFSILFQRIRNVNGLGVFSHGAISELIIYGCETLKANYQVVRTVRKLHLPNAAILVLATDRTLPSVDFLVC